MFEQINADLLESPEKLAAFGATLFAACLAGLKAALKRGEPAAAFEWSALASRLMVRSGTFGEMASVELERGILELAGQIPIPPRQKGIPGRTRVVHVLTSAYRIFGHTTLCRKWIELDGAPNVHSVLLLGQVAETPANLTETVAKQGGEVIRLDASLPPLARAQALREWTFANADVVVLHIHQDDPMAPVAFGVAGGPPVMLMNHADHSFWVGAMESDMVLEIRESGHETTIRNRGIARARSEILYIPLRAEVDLKEDRASFEKLRRAKRSELGIGADELVFLTVGNGSKYVPMGEISFLKAAEAILAACPKARIVAAGPKPEGQWAELSKKTGNRLMAVGNQDDLAPFHAISDIYLEGMPAGSLTAMLEACLAGLACVCAPAFVSPPFTADGLAFAETPRPADLTGYVREAVMLAGDAEERQRRGERLRERIQALHCGNAWRLRLHEITAKLPEVHATYTDLKPAPLPGKMLDFWLNYLHRDGVATAERKMLATVTYEAVSWCPDVRQNLVGSVDAALKSPDSKQKIVQAVFPALDMGQKDFASAAEAVNEVEILARLIERSLDEQPRLTLAMLAVRMVWRRPALLKQKLFMKEAFKVWAGPGIYDAGRKLVGSKD